MEGRIPYYDIPIVPTFGYSATPLAMLINRTADGKDQMFSNRMQAGQYVEGTVLSIICFVAILGNISIWIIILRSRSLRTITNSFLLVLSAFDLLVSVINMPITVLTIFAGEWIFSEEACRGFGFSNMVTLCGSVLSLCNISINRYIMVCKSTYFSRIYTKKNTFIMICISVATTIGVSIPPLIGWCEYSFTPEQYICFANWPLSLSYALFMIFCCFGIPLIVMIFCNYKIYKTVKASKNKIMDSYSLSMSKKKRVGDIANSETSTNSSYQNSHEDIASSDIYKEIAVVDPSYKMSYSIHIDVKSKDENVKGTKAKPEEVRLARVLGVVVVVFFICWFPYCISMILSIVAPNSVHPGFHMATLLIGYFNSCCNPIIYGILNKRFANGFKRLYCFWRSQ